MGRSKYVSEAVLEEKGVLDLVDFVGRLVFFLVSGLSGLRTHVGVERTFCGAQWMMLFPLRMPQRVSVARFFFSEFPALPLGYGRWVACHRASFIKVAAVLSPGTSNCVLSVPVL